jgi:hypothetical protein
MQTNHYLSFLFFFLDKKEKKSGLTEKNQEIQGFASRKF